MAGKEQSFDGNRVIVILADYMKFFVVTELFTVLKTEQCAKALMKILLKHSIYHTIIYERF